VVTDEYLEHRRFFDLVDLAGLPPQGTLEGTSGVKSDSGPYPTSLVERGETAWRTPFREMTCEQVRLMVEQKMGLQWLGRPALAFAARHPDALITNYPGEMALLCLEAAEDLAEHAQPEFGAWIQSDFGWMDDVFSWSRSMRREAKAALERAREIAT
jgi:hypothetical protein